MDLEEPFLLYLPERFSEQENEEKASNLQAIETVNGVIPLLINGEIDEEYFLDVVESHNVDMNNYIEVVNENLDEFLRA